MPYFHEFQPKEQPRYPLSQSSAGYNFPPKKFLPMFRETPATTFEHLATPEMIAKYNDEEEDENLKPITRPMEELKTQSSLSAMEKQNDKKFPFKSDPGLKNETKARDVRPNGGAKRDDPDVVIIDDDRKRSKSLSPLSPPPGARDRLRRSRDRSLERRRRGSPRRRSRSRSRSRRDSPRRVYDKRRDFSPDRRRGYSPDRRRPDYSPDRRKRDRRDTSAERRHRDYDDRRARDLSPRRRDFDDRRRRDADQDRYDRTRDRSPYTDRRRSPDRHRSLDTRRSSERHISVDRASRRSDDKKRDKYDEYRAELRKLEIELEDQLKQFESRPEKHPLYNEEWKSFWNKRYKEVQQQGRDPNTYDFKPEWIVYWGKRMKEINSEEFRLKSEELKRQFGVDKPKQPAVGDLLGGASPVSSDEEKEPVTVEDIKNTWKGLTGTDLSGPPTKKRSPTPKMAVWDEPPPVVKEEPVAVSNRSYEVAPPVVHCLRLLSVLEGYLGSLGPRAIELLSRALVLERSGHRKSMTLLDQPDVHVFFDTVKEKIRGALMAYIVEKHLVNTCRMSINVIERMLKANPPKENPSASLDLFRPPPRAPPAPAAVVPSYDMAAKMAVAQQIAGALVAQGRTDVTQEELEALINAVVGIAQASNASFNATTSSINFFSQLNMKTSTADAHINKLLNSMIKGVTGKSDADEKPEVKTDKDKEEEDLKEKLSKFNTLSREEQQSLIAILKELEKTDPKKVEALRKYVTVGLVVKKDEPSAEAAPVNENAESQSNDDSKNTPKRPSVAKSDDEDDDDDDYSFEDVYKAASEKLKTNKKLPSQQSVDHNSDSNMSRASTTNPLPTVSEKAKLSDFKDVFGPQRNPAEKPVDSAGSSFKFVPKNSAPEVTDPNSQMSLDEDVMVVNSGKSYLSTPAPPPSIPGLGSADSAAKPAPGYGSNTIDYGFTVNPENSQSSFQDDMYDSQGGGFGGTGFRGNNDSNSYGRGQTNQLFGNSAPGPFGGNRPSGVSGPFGGGGGPFGGNRGGGQFGNTGAPFGNTGPAGPFGGSAPSGGPFGGSGNYGGYGGGGPHGGGNYGDSRDNFAPSRGPGGSGPFNFGDQRAGFQGNNPPDNRKYFPDSGRYYQR